jgi:ribonuclease HII
MIVGTADTKKTHSFHYWDEIFKRISHSIKDGLIFLEEKIPPWHVDKYNLNKIMDVVYQRILASFFRNVNLAECRIVIDDYGIGPTLRRFLNFLEKQGAEVVISQKSDDIYLEARVASIIAKRNREAVVKAINENDDYKIEGISIGSGNAGNKQTLEWLEKWYSSGKPWPWFIKRSFSTIRKIEGFEGKAKKIAPPIKDNLLSEDFKKELDSGKLDIRALLVVCPHCGATSKVVLFTPEGTGFTARCPNCRKPIEDLNFILRYYCGFIVPDSNVINRGLLGKDLEKSRFFEDFTVLIPAVVRYECDTPGGKKEFERLGRFASISRIKLKEVGDFEPSKFQEMTSQERDDLIMKTCIEENAILLSADNQVKGLAVAKDIFTIFVP